MALNKSLSTEHWQNKLGHFSFLHQANQGINYNKNQQQQL